MASVPLQSIAFPSNPLEWLAVVVVAVLLPPYVHLYGVTVYELVSVWRNDSVDIASAPTGEVVEIEGEVESLGQTLSAPLTERDAVAYSMKVRRSTPVRDFEDMTERWTDSIPFYVTDDTGRALLDPENARFEYTAETTQFLSEEKCPPDDLRQRLEPNMSRVPWPSLGPTESPSGRTGSEEVRFEERRLEPRDRVHVRAKLTPLEDSGYDGGAPIDPTVVVHRGQRYGSFSSVVDRLLGRSSPRYKVNVGDERSRFRSLILLVIGRTVFGFLVFGALLQYAVS